jgi:hypothetical protein
MFIFNIKPLDIVLLPTRPVVAVTALFSMGREKKAI